METAGKLLLAIAAALAIVGLLALGLARLGVGRLPGDLVFRGESWTVFVPLGTMLALSIVLTIVFNVFFRR